MLSGPKNKEMFARARKVLPHGVGSNFRYYGDEDTLILKSAKGAYIWDYDDKKYLDYRVGFGPVILGHGNEYVNRFVAEAVANGVSYAMTHRYEIEAAEKVAKMTGMDMVRFANSGTEATMAAIRIARAYTGRTKVIKFEGGYHGVHDTVMWSSFPPHPGSGTIESPIPVPNAPGVPMSLYRDVIILPWNNQELLERKVKEQWGEIACIIFEPIFGDVASLMPVDGYLQQIRDLCDQYGIVMIMDEVKTGFRIANGGAQEYFGITGDLATYAKAMGNGFPAAAIAGKREIMGRIGPGGLPHGGTFCGNVVATAATSATIDELEKGALKKVVCHGQRIMAGWKKVLDERGVPHVILGVPGMPGLLFTEKERILDYRDYMETDLALKEAIMTNCVKRGVMAEIDTRLPWMFTASHTDADADFAIGVFEEAVDEALA